MRAQRCAPFRPLARQPGWRLPHGTVDCHVHVFGPDAVYPHAPERLYTPPEASLAAYEALAGALGIARAVMVQPSPYGLDNGCTLAAMSECRIPTRGVVVLDPSVTDGVLDAYHEQGVRGVRINLVTGGGPALQEAQAIAARIRGRGWHLQILADVSRMENLPALIASLGLPVVFDHLGHVPAAKGVADAGFQALLALVRDGAAWVKLSGTYRMTARTIPPYDDVRPFMDALVGAAPGQLVWGTDWPHPIISVPMPEDGELLDQFGEWLTDETLRNTILVENPVRLYGFPEIPGRNGAQRPGP